MVRQSTVDSVQVSWTPPSPPPDPPMYFVMIFPGSINVSASFSPHTIRLPPGEYNITVASRGENINEAAGPVQVTVRGEELYF